MKINYKTKPRSVTIKNVQNGDYILINSVDVSNIEGSPIYKLHNPKIMDGVIHWSNNKKDTISCYAWILAKKHTYRFLSETEAQDIMKQYKKPLSNEN